MGGPPVADEGASSRPPPTEETSAPSQPVDQPSSRDLEQLAPLGSSPSIYGLRAKVYPATVRFTAELRGTEAKPAEGGEAPQP